MSAVNKEIETDTAEALESKTTEDQVAEPASETNTKDSEYETFISKETLRESPIEWPERFPGMDEFLTASDTPIHTPKIHPAQISTAKDMAAIRQFSLLAPEQLLEKINAMHDQIYQLGLLESKEMTRGKLLGIFDRERFTKATDMRN